MGIKRWDNVKIVEDERMTAHGRTITRAAGALASVSLLTGTVRAAPLAQINITPEAVTALGPIIGGGALFTLIGLYLLSRIMSSKQPATLTDALLKDSEARSKDADNRATELKLERDRINIQDEKDKKRDAQFDRMLAQLEKDHERMHNSEASLARLSADQLKVEQETEKRLVAIERDIRTVTETLQRVSIAAGVNSGATLEQSARLIASASQQLAQLAINFGAVLADWKRAMNTQEAAKTGPLVTITTPAAAVTTPPTPFPDLPSTPPAPSADAPLPMPTVPEPPDAKG